MDTADNKWDRPFYDLLPELYKQDPVMDTLLEAFEEQFLRIERTIDSLPETYYTPEKAPDDFLDFLWRMVGLPSGKEIFSQKQKRELIPLAYSLQRQKGTRTALFWLLKAFASDLCGRWVSPMIVEYENWCEYDCSDQLKQAYRDRFGGEDDFTVLLPPEPVLQSPDVKARLLALLEEYSPANTEPHLEVLGSGIRLGENSFLGFSTYLQDDKNDNNREV